MIQHPDYPAINTTIIEIYNYYFFNHVIIIIIIIIDINPRSPLTIQHFTSDSKPKLGAFINTRAIMLHV